LDIALQFSPLCLDGYTTISNPGDGIQCIILQPIQKW